MVSSVQHVAVIWHHHSFISWAHLMHFFDSFSFSRLSWGFKASLPLYSASSAAQLLSSLSFFVNRPLPLLHGQYPLFLSCTEARAAFFLLYYSAGLIQRSWKMGERKPKLLVRLQMKGHGTRLINSYDARVRWLSLYAVYAGVCSCKYLMAFWPH